MAIKRYVESTETGRVVERVFANRDEMLLADADTRYRPVDQLEGRKRFAEQVTRTVRAEEVDGRPKFFDRDRERRLAPFDSRRRRPARPPRPSYVNY